MTGMQVFAEWIASFTETILYLKIIRTISECQFSKKKQIRYFLMLSAFIAVGMVMLNLLNLSISFPTLLYVVIALALGAQILYRGKFLEFLFASIGYVAFLTFVDMASVFVMTQVGMGSIINQVLSGFSTSRIVYIAAIKILEILIVFLFCMLLQKRVIYKREKRYTITVICLVLGSVGSVYWVMQSEILVGFKLNFVQIMLSLSSILVICTTYFFLQMREVKKEQEYTEQKNQILEKNYLAAKESYESNARLYHDMRNHFILLQQYLADGKNAEAQEYLGKIVGDRSTYSIGQWTGIEAVDYILSQKADIARRQGIQVNIHAEYPKDCKIEPVDLCTILTNVFDNAIEACEKCPQGVERKITLTIRRIHQFIIIKIANSSMDSPTIRKGAIVTSKKDQRSHGWGLQNVKVTVEKYHGAMEFDCSDSVFTMNIMLFYQ